MHLSRNEFQNVHQNVKKNKYKFPVNLINEIKILEINFSNSAPGREINYEKSQQR